MWDILIGISKGLCCSCVGLCVVLRRQMRVNCLIQAKRVHGIAWHGRARELESWGRGRGREGGLGKQ